MEYPHWLMMAGTLLVIAGLIGLLISRRQQAKVQDDPANEQSRSRVHSCRSCRIF